jgi:hypothetical protein
MNCEIQQPFLSTQGKHWNWNTIAFPSTQNGCSIEHEMGEAGKEAETIYEEHKSIAYVHPWTM